MSADPSPQQPRAEVVSRSEILVVVMVYALFAALWILLSDRAVEAVFDDPAQIFLASTLKGVLFVAVTSLLLYRLMRRMARPVTGVTATGTPPARPHPALPFVLLAAAILTLTVSGIAYTFTDQRSKEEARLQAIADLKTRQIVDWLKERERDAGFVQSNVLFSVSYRRWQDAGDPASRGQLETRLEQFRQAQGLSAIQLLDSRGERLWGAGRVPREIAPPLRDAVRQAALDLRIHRVGPYLGVAGTPRLDFVVPLAAAGTQPPLIVLHTDPSDWLYHTLQSWPVASPTGETVLIRRDGDQILHLNELRHRKNTALKLRIPLAREGGLAAKVISGKAKAGRLVEGKDYRGVSALGVVRAVPGTDWFLVAKVDRVELYRGAVDQAIWTGFAGLLAMFMAAAGYYLMRQRQQLALAGAAAQAQAERLRALTLLDAIADSSDDAIFAKDLDGRYMLFNRAAAKFVGKPAEDVLGRDDRSLFAAEQAEMLMAIGRKVIAENRIHTQEETLDTPQGVRIFLGTKGPLRDADGRVIGIFGISRDITGRKQADAALIMSEKRFHDIADASADWVWEVDADARYTYASDSVQGSLGYTPAEIVGKTPFDLMPPEEAERVRAEFAGIAARRESFRELDNINLHKDGSLRHVQTNGVPILDADGKLLGYRGLDRDISEKKRAEERLRTSEERLQLALDATNDGLWDWDLRSGAVYRTSHYFELTGYLPEEATPDFGFFQRTVHPDDLPDVLKTIEAHIQGKTPSIEFDYRLITRTGEMKWVRVRGRAVERDAVGAPLRMVGTITEITADKAAEETLRWQAEELARRNAELERFNRNMVGRELDMIALKQRVNELSRQLGQEPPYPLDFLDDPRAQANREAAP